MDIINNIIAFLKSLIFGHSRKPGAPKLNYKAPVYNNDSWNAPPHSSKNGLCLSGGGSRALAGGLGQLIGLRSIQTSNGKTLLDEVGYLSSVSGSSWLTSIFTYSTNSNLDDLLGVYSHPTTLTENNIGALPAGSIGHVPSRLDFDEMLDIVHEKIGFENIILYPEVRKWVWAVIVGEQILKPYGLYSGTMQGTGKYITPMPDRFFSLNEDYMKERIQPLGESKIHNGSLSSDDFYFLQKGRPYPIINANIKLVYDESNSPLLAIQGTPIATGATGKISQSGVSIESYGGVESFGFTSELISQSDSDALAGIARRYSLVDIVSCSSVFFAGMVGKQIASHSAAYAVGKGLKIPSMKKERSVKKIENSILDNFASLVPQYNFWPVNTENTTNSITGFADGGSLEYTGLLGMLARSDATNIIVCVNSQTPLGKSESFYVEGYDKKIAKICTDIPILFGYQPKPVGNAYIKFNDYTPADIKYLKTTQIFESEAFGPLVNALFAAGNGQKSPAVASTPSLNVCDNPYAGITSQRGPVNIFWFYTDYAEDWVSEIEKNSPELAEKIRFERELPLSDFYNFPNYNTVIQVNLNPTQVNAMAQYQAWAFNQVKDQLMDLFK